MAPSVASPSSEAAAGPLLPRGGPASDRGGQAGASVQDREGGLAWARRGRGEEEGRESLQSPEPQPLLVLTSSQAQVQNKQDSSTLLGAP